MSWNKIDTAVFERKVLDSAGELACCYCRLTIDDCRLTIADWRLTVIGDWPVQFLAANAILETEALAQAVDFDVEGVPTRVMSAEHLVAIALTAGRPKDFNRILHFLEPGTVNRDKLNRILEKHELMPKWAKFRQRYLDE